VLLVDDEFDKGVADTLLQVLFRQTAFTVQYQEQAVYSSKQNDVAKARFVCVKTAEAARNWLRYWGDLPFSEEALDAMSRGWVHARRTNDECRTFGDWLLGLGIKLGNSEEAVRRVLKRGDPNEGSIEAPEVENPLLEAAKDVLCDIDNPEGSPRRCQP